MADDAERSRGRTGNADGTESWHAVELQRLTADIAARLRKACAHLQDDEFSALVLDIARRRMRFEGTDPTRVPDRK